MTEGEKADLKTFMAPGRRRVAEAAKCNVAQACADLRSSSAYGLRKIWDNCYDLWHRLLPAEHIVGVILQLPVTGGRLRCQVFVDEGNDGTSR